MFRKIFSAVFITGMFIALDASTSARVYALGQAYFLGDILGSAGSAWQMLGYPDQVQFTWPIADQQPGPALFIKSLGENAAVGITANVFDKRTKGSVFMTPYYQNSTQFAGLFDEDQRLFPNYPQLNFAFKIAGQKFGLNAFYQAETFDKFDFIPSSTTQYIKSEKDGSVSDFGGCVSARIGFGNFGWYPWIRVAVPQLDGKKPETTVSDSAGTLKTVQTSSHSTMADDGSRNLMANVGSCFDYTFGDWGWGIIGGWYRNEQYKFMQTSTANPTTYSPKYFGDFYDYFAAFTPKIFDDCLIGFEYQGGYQKTGFNYENLSNPDSTFHTWFNDFIFVLEKPVKLNNKWMTKITPRGSMALSVGRKMEQWKKQIPGNPGLFEVHKEWTPISTLNYEKKDGLVAYFGCGMTLFRRFTIDICSDVFTWQQQGGSMFLGPPPTYMTMTVDLH